MNAVECWYHYFLDRQAYNNFAAYFFLAHIGSILTPSLFQPGCYPPSAELKTNQARTIFVQPIQPLQFPGATTANITNLFVKTRSPEGIERLYTFNVVHRDGQPTNNGIAISTVVPGQEPSVTLADNRTAAIGDIERGLDIAILRGYTPPNDPVVFKVREFIALARNGTAIAKAAEKTNLSMSVVISLGQLGISRELLFGTPQTPSPSLPSNSNLLNSNPRKP
jgi:hypothetical protein